MNRLGGVIAVATLVGVAACSGGDEPAAQPAEAEVVEETLPTLPSVATDDATTVTTTEAPPTTSEPPASTTTSTTESEPVVQLGTWDWGAPCRVPVRQWLEPQMPGRTFDLVVTELGDGYRIEFENVTLGQVALTEQETAAAMLDAVAVLPSITLDGQGEFGGFEGLDDSLGDLADAADDSVGVAEAAEAAEAFAGVVRAQTFDAWGGFWTGSGALGPEPMKSQESRALVGSVYDAEVSRSATAVLSALLTAKIGEAAWFSYNEDGIVAEGLDGTQLIYRIDADTLIGLERSRPHESEITLEVQTIETDGTASPVFRFFADTTFDWENSVGCE